MRKTVILGVIVVAPFVLGGVSAVTAADPRLVACGDGRADNRVVAAFVLPEVSAIRDTLPQMGYSPELEGDTRPGYVVVFADGYVPPPFTGIGEAPVTLDGAVCVVQADGTVNLYSDVSRAGFVPPQ